MRERKREREGGREGACRSGVDLGLEALSSDAHSVCFCSLIVLLLLLLLCLSVLFSYQLYFTNVSWVPPPPWQESNSRRLPSEGFTRGPPNS